MDPAALRWFQRFQRSHAADTQVEFWQASDIVQQLLYHHTIREAFFPTTILNTTMIRERLAGIDAFTTSELADLNDQNVDSYLARLQAYDERFRYAVTFNRDGTPAEWNPGALFTVTRGSTVLHAFPNDREALKRHPAHATFSVRGSGVDKFLDHYRTGTGQTFTAEELVSMTTCFDFLLPSDRSGASLVLSPLATDETVPLRVTFGEGDHAMTYEYVAFRKARGGTEETLLESVTNLPFQISLLVHTNGSGNLSFSPRCGGHTIKEVQKQVRAIMIALRTGAIDLYSLMLAKPLPRFGLHGVVPERLQHYFDLVNDLAAIADAYEVDFTMPNALTNEDCDALGLLSGLLAGITLPAGAMSLELVQTADANPQTAAAFEGCPLRFMVPEFPDDIILFGTKITTGPIQYDIPKARIREADALHEFLKTAPIGARITVVIDPIGPVTLKRHLPH
jgi:hypothetical protein